MSFSKPLTQSGSINESVNESINENVNESVNESVNETLAEGLTDIYQVQRYELHDTQTLPQQLFAQNPVHRQQNQNIWLEEQQQRLRLLVGNDEHHEKHKDQSRHNIQHSSQHGSQHDMHHDSIQNIRDSLQHEQLQREKHLRNEGSKHLKSRHQQHQQIQLPRIKPSPVQNDDILRGSIDLAQLVTATNDDGIALENGAKKKRKMRVPWNEQETRDLLTGCSIHGVGNWKTIHADTRFRFNKRSPVDLKDRFRTMFPAAYLEKQEPGKTEVNIAGSILFPLKSRKRRQNFTAEEDAALLRGFTRYGAGWAQIQKDPELNLGHRRNTDLRDRFRNAFPEKYAAVGLTPIGPSKTIASRNNEPEPSFNSISKDYNHQSKRLRSVTRTGRGGSRGGTRGGVRAARGTRGSTRTSKSSSRGRDLHYSTHESLQHSPVLQLAPYITYPSQIHLSGLPSLSKDPTNSGKKVSRRSSHTGLEKSAVRSKSEDNSSTNDSYTSSCTDNAKHSCDSHLTNEKI